MSTDMLAEAIGEETKRVRIRAKGISEPPEKTWSNCFKIGRLVIVGGLAARDEEGNLVGGNDPLEQAVYTFQRVQALLEAADGRMSDIVKLEVYLRDIRYRPSFLEARRQFFEGDFPPCLVIGDVSLASPELLIEIVAIAILGSGD